MPGAAIKMIRGRGIPVDEICRRLEYGKALSGAWYLMLAAVSRTRTTVYCAAQVDLTSSFSERSSSFNLTHALCGMSIATMSFVRFQIPKDSSSNRRSD